MVVGHFLAGIAAVMWSVKDGKYLLLHRAQSKDFAPGVWECVTGRVEQGEGYEDALNRETREELGLMTKPVCILGTAHFYRGKQSSENELLGVIFACEVDSDAPLSLSNEHDDSCWVTYEQAMALLASSDPSVTWLRRVLKRAEIMRKILPDMLIQHYVNAGFELG